MTSTPLKRRLGDVESSYPSFPLTPVKIRFSVGKNHSKGATKRRSADADMTPAQIKTKSKSMKMFQSSSPTKRDSVEAGMSPAKTRSKTRKMSKSEAKADSIKNKNFFQENIQSYKSKIYQYIFSISFKK